MSSRIDVNIRLNPFLKISERDVILRGFRKRKSTLWTDFCCKKHTLADFEMTYFFAVYLLKSQ